MRRLIRVFFVLLPMFVTVQALSAQDSGPPVSSGQSDEFQLEQNYPNPFNPETTIPFVLAEDLFVDGRPVVVSVRILNLLGQFIAAPVALGHSSGEGLELSQLDYTQPGRYEAFWDGRNQNNQQVASGIYFLVLTVNGKSKSLKMYVRK